MQLAPGQAGDPARLATLAGYGILDTPAERGFDDIVSLACMFCGTPVALVSFVARDRQWFKARVGFDACETPLSQSVCAHALGLDDLLVIPDLAVDPRTRDNPLVVGEPFLRFYAGAPLRTPEGAALGTLCVIDHEPRPDGLTPEQTEALRALARQVMVQLELHRAVENRGQALAAKAMAEEQFRLASEAAGIGVWDLDVTNGELRWDARVRALFGVPERGVVTYEGSYLPNLHPDDREDADAAVRAALLSDGSRAFDLEYRVIAADTGAVRWLSAQGQGIVEDGRMVRFIGTVRDVTEHKAAVAALSETERRYRFAARATTDAIWDWDFATNHVLWNEALSEAYGHAPDEVEPTGDWWIGHIHPDDRARIDASIHVVIDGAGTAWTDEYRFLRADGSYAEVLDRGFVIRDGNGVARRMIGAMLDLTGLRATESRLRESERQLGLERGLLQAVLRQAPVGISVTDAASSWTTLVNDRARAMTAFGTGARPDVPTESPVALRADGTPLAPDAYPTARTLRDGRAVEGEMIWHRGAGTGEMRRYEVSSAPVTGEDGGLLAVMTLLVDVEDRMRAEALQDLLNNELSHRMKNLLAIVQAIASSTLRGATDIEAAREVLAGRLIALGTAHDILLGGAAVSARLEAVVRQGVGVQAVEGRIVYEGPDIEIGAKPALALALMLHELTTNAVKYGALSVAGGRVTVDATLVEASEGALLRIAWTERGGPAVTPPSRKGFGSRLIERGLTAQVGGTLSMDYAREGLRCVVEAPLAEFQSTA